MSDSSPDPDVPSSDESAVPPRVPGAESAVSSDESTAEKATEKKVAPRAPRTPASGARTPRTASGAAAAKKPAAKRPTGAAAAKRPSGAAAAKRPAGAAAAKRPTAAPKKPAAPRTPAATKPVTIEEQVPPVDAEAVEVESAPTASPGDIVIPPRPPLPVRPPLPPLPTTLPDLSDLDTGAAPPEPEPDDTIEISRRSVAAPPDAPASDPGTPADVVLAEDVPAETVDESAPIAAPADVAEDSVDAEPAVAPTVSAEPEVAAESEVAVEPEVAAEPEVAVEPEAELQATAEPVPAGEVEPDGETGPPIDAEEAETTSETLVLSEVTDPPSASEPGTVTPVVADLDAADDGVAGEPALRVTGLRKSFGATAAVGGIDLVVPAGSFYGLVGPNGAGKTTTLSMIAGLLRPDAGSIRIAGLDARAKSRQAKRLIGVLPDRLRTFDRLTGRQLLSYSGLLRGLDSATVDRRVADLGRAFDLTTALGRPVSDYSAGMTKKVMLAGAMIHSPRLLVLDEPFEAVDPVSSGVILDILSTYVEHGGTVLLSSHGMELVERVCTRVAVIVAGQVLAEGTVDEVRGESTLEERFLQLTGGSNEVEGLEWLHTFSD